MSGSSRSGHHRSRLSPFLLLALAAIILGLTGFGFALAARSALPLTNYFPLIFRAIPPTATATNSPAPTKTSTRPAPTQTQTAAAGKITIVDFAFQPAEITIHVGETVEWENKGSFPHTSTSDNNLWDSGSLAPNQKFTHTFNSTGDFPFHCSFHSEMTGIIHVIPNP